MRAAKSQAGPSLQPLPLVLWQSQLFGSGHLPEYSLLAALGTPNRVLRHTSQPKFSGLDRVLVAQTNRLDPDVSVGHRAVVALEHDRPLGFFVVEGAGSRGTG